MKLLILCTGNSCRSQMAEGLLKSFDSSLDVYSAGTQPSMEVHPIAVMVMAEKGIDISGNKPENVNRYLAETFDYVITVCGDARENCPVFTGPVKQQLHIGFEDPAKATGSDEEILAVFRHVRDEIEERFRAFYVEQLKSGHEIR
ncbi:MAG TPA: arsenate reductase ArsC [Bacteroidales bacterium]|nr:arsenate reductase ArsC [Bacteroidales bacterium]